MSVRLYVCMCACLYVHIPHVYEHLFYKYFVRRSVGQSGYNRQKSFATYGCFHHCFRYKNIWYMTKNKRIALNNLIYPGSKNSFNIYEKKALPCTFCNFMFFWKTKLCWSLSGMKMITK